MPDFDEIFSEYFRIVYKYALALCRNVAVAEDITSETFLKAYKAIDDFKGECELRVWLCQIAKNTYFSLLKKNKYEMPLDDIELESNCADFLLDITMTIWERFMQEGTYESKIQKTYAECKANGTLIWSGANPDK